MPEGIEPLQPRGISLPALARLKAFVIKINFCGAFGRDRDHGFLIIHIGIDILAVLHTEPFSS
jgi:hypothetical protein